jgi:hypothetical protein
MGNDHGSGVFGKRRHQPTKKETTPLPPVGPQSRRIGGPYSGEGIACLSGERHGRICEGSRRRETAGSGDVRSKGTAIERRRAQPKITANNPNVQRTRWKLCVPPALMLMWRDALKTGSPNSHATHPRAQHLAGFMARIHALIDLRSTCEAMASTSTPVLVAGPAATKIRNDTGVTVE